LPKGYRSGKQKNGVWNAGSASGIRNDGRWLRDANGKKGSVQKVDWSHYTAIPNKEYTVVGTIVLRPSDTKTLNADLMAEAVKLGANDVINVRLDVEIDEAGKNVVVGVTAVAIKYSDASLTSTTTTTTESDGKTTTVTTTTPLMFGGGGGSAGGTDEKPKKKFLGLF
jgi:hypothetical protein